MLLISVPDGGAPIDVEHATDEQFQAFVNASGIPVKDKGIAEWSFDDRCGFINWPIQRAKQLPFVEQNNSPARELFMVAQMASEGK